MFHNVSIAHLKKFRNCFLYFYKKKPLPKGDSEGDFDYAEAERRLGILCLSHDFVYKHRRNVFITEEFGHELAAASR